jgi:hypothetical protein
MTGSVASAGRGRLAELLALRGGQAAPETPFVIEHREALIYMLYEAAELEHGIMCQYLFAAFSLKQREDEGLTADALEAVLRWRRVVAHVATEEMLHLALVQNLLSAIGSAPHLARPNLPTPARHYPAGVNLTLVPFGEPALRHFMFLERPEGMELKGAQGIDAPVHEAVPLMAEGDIVPQPQDFATLGHLYRSIEHGIDHLAEKFGERNLFVGPTRAQATSDYFHWPELVPVTDLASAHRAIDTILEQGEGARGHWQNAHFGQFVRILDEYRQLKAANPDFEPARPVLFATVRPSQHDDTVPRITEPGTSRCTDLFNVGYEVLLQMLHRYFAHTEETDAQLATLSSTAIALMVGVLKPLGDLITTLPVGPEHPGMTAGASFELFYENDYLLPPEKRGGRERLSCYGLGAEPGAAWWTSRSSGVDGEGVEVVGQDRPAGPDPLALVALEAAPPQPVAALEVADAALAAGAVAGEAPAGAPGARLGPARDERPGGCDPGQGLDGRPRHKAAV